MNLYAEGDGTAIVTVVAPEVPIVAGGTFAASIIVDPAGTVAGAQFDLSFDPSLIAVDAVDEGNFLSQDGASTYFNQGQIDNQGGTVTGVWDTIITPGQTVSTAGVLASITFVAKSNAGTCLLSLSNTLLGDQDGQPVAVSTIDDHVTIVVNNPPELNAIGDKSTAVGELLEFTVSATDSDGDDLTFLASNLPPGASFDPQTGTFSWTPSDGHSGTYADVHFEVSDGFATDSENITITVSPVYEDWDTNEDELVNVLDLILVGQHWGEEGTPGWRREDVNRDGVINTLDLVLIGQHWTG